MWAAYSQSFLERLVERYKERGASDADRLVDGIDRLNETVLDRWRKADFESQYLQCQAWDCEEDNPVGLRDDEDLPVNSPLLQEVFVPLELSADAMLSGYDVSQLRQGNQGEETVTQIWDLLRLVKENKNFRQIAIRAWGGYGKTTLMKHLAFVYSVGQYRQYNAPKFTPFLLYLAGCWQEILTDEAMTLPKLLSTYHLQRLPQGKELQPQENWAKNSLKQGQALVLFDGFDEIPPKERAKMSEWLSTAMNDYRNSVFLLTSRPTAYKDDFVAKKPSTSFWIQDFNEEQRKKFVEQWYFCQEKTARGGRVTPKVNQIVETRSKDLLAQIKARPELNDIAGNVLLLNMMARFHRDRNQAQLPQRKVELYQDICELQLGRRPKGKGISLLLDSIAQRQEIIQGLALEMMMFAEADDNEDENFKRITQVDLLECIQGLLQQVDGEVDSEEFLYQMVTVSELMVERDREIYQFAHLSFQEFLAARELQRLEKLGEEILRNYLTVNSWQDVILFYASLINPTKLIQFVLAEAPELAYLIYSQTDKYLHLSKAEHLALESLKSSIVSARHQKLEVLLITAQEDISKWLEADEETYKLLLTAIGKEEGRKFTDKDWINFPCDELKAIDELWRRYSNGLYGFSAQQEAFLQFGEAITFNGSSLRTWYRFCDAVKWRVNGKYVSRQNLIENHGKQVKGTLPRIDRRRYCTGGDGKRGVKSGRLALSRILYRFSTC